MTIPNKQPALGSIVLYTRRAPGGPGHQYTLDELTSVAVVCRVAPGGSVDLCAFTPSPQPAHCVDFDATGIPNTWRFLPGV